MKTMFLALFCATILNVSNAQNNSAGKMYIKMGVGIGQTATALEGKPSIQFPINMQLQYKLSSKFSLGLHYNRASYDGPEHHISEEQIHQLKHTQHQVLMQAAFHIDRVQKLDFYGGMQLGFDLSKLQTLQGNFDYFANHLGLKPKKMSMLYTGILGVNYNLDEGLVLYSELGFGISILKLGLGYQF